MQSAGAEPGPASTAIERIQQLAGQNVIAAIDFRFAEFGAKIDKIDAQKGMIWTLISILGTAGLGGLWASPRCSVKSSPSDLEGLRDSGFRPEQGRSPAERRAEPVEGVPLCVGISRFSYRWGSLC